MYFLQVHGELYTTICSLATTAKCCYTLVPQALCNIEFLTHVYFTCIRLSFSNPHTNFFIPRPTCSAPGSTRTHSSAGSHTHLTNSGTRKLTRAAQDSTVYVSASFVLTRLFVPTWGTKILMRAILNVHAGRIWPADRRFATAGLQQRSPKLALISSNVSVHKHQGAHFLKRNTFYALIGNAWSAHLFAGVGLHLTNFLFVYFKCLMFCTNLHSSHVM